MLSFFSAVVLLGSRRLSRPHSLLVSAFARSFFNEVLPSLCKMRSYFLSQIYAEIFSSAEMLSSPLILPAKNDVLSQKT